MVHSAQVHHHQTCPLKTGTNGCAQAKGFPRPGQNVFNWQVVEAQIERSDFIRRKRGGGLQFTSIKAANEQSRPLQSINAVRISGKMKSLATGLRNANGRILRTTLPIL